MKKYYGTSKFNSQDFILFVGKQAELRSLYKAMRRNQNSPYIPLWADFPRSLVLDSLSEAIQGIYLELDPEESVHDTYHVLRTEYLVEYLVNKEEFAVTEF